MRFALKVFALSSLTLLAWIVIAGVAWLSINVWCENELYGSPHFYSGYWAKFRKALRWLKYH